MTVSIQTIGADTDYITKHNSNYAALKSAVEALQAVTGGATTSTVVPVGLKYIFDRKGVVGDNSFQPVAGSLSGPSYNLTVAAGAFWDGANLAYYETAVEITMSGKSSGTYYLDISSAGVASVSSSASSRTAWQFYYNSSTHIVSDVELYSGVAALFSGEDFARCLSSDVFGTLTSLSDRFDAIEAELGTSTDYYGQDDATTDGLTFGYKAGRVRDDNVVWSTPAGTIALTNNSTNYIEVSPTSGTVYKTTTGFTSGRVPLFTVVTISGAISSVTDKRTWLATGGGGGGGGHTQNTDEGTSNSTFTMLLGVTGTPVDNAELVVERGDDPNVGIRWDETANKWKFTNDGLSYEELFSPSSMLADQELTKYVAVDNPELVLNLANQSTSVAYAALDLTSNIPADYGATAVVLRVLFTDEAPDVDILTLFRRTDSGVSPAEAFTVWSGNVATVVIPVDPTALSVDYFIVASGTGTADLKVYLLGYFERIVGVGTVAKETVQAGIEVAATGSTETDIASACNRGLVHYLKVEETGGLVTGTYNIEFYKEDTYSTLLYQATGISPATAYEDHEPFWINDLDNSSELHVKITNNDAGAIGTYTVTLNYEKFA